MCRSEEKIVVELRNKSLKQMDPEMLNAGTKLSPARTAETILKQHALVELI